MFIVQRITAYSGTDWFELFEGKEAAIAFAKEKATEEWGDKWSETPPKYDTLQPVFGAYRGEFDEIIVTEQTVKDAS